MDAICGLELAKCDLCGETWHSASAHCPTCNVPPYQPHVKAACDPDWYPPSPNRLYPLPGDGTMDSLERALAAQSVAGRLHALSGIANLAAGKNPDGSKPAAEVNSGWPVPCPCGRSDVHWPHFLHAGRAVHGVEEPGGGWSDGVEQRDRACAQHIQDHLSIWSMAGTSSVTRGAREDGPGIAALDLKTRPPDYSGWVDETDLLPDAEG